MFAAKVRSLKLSYRVRFRSRVQSLASVFVPAARRALNISAVWFLSVLMIASMVAWLGLLAWAAASLLKWVATAFWS